ncbi:MAG TPA: M20/M25/M40 family metallo-hydrolase [Candidatus Binatia bacterium]|jgi:acetylornithine deacetylase/succinyl-diaminopimelate desuccinylase-like protein
MDAQTVKKLVEKNLHYEEVKRILVKLVQTPSPQTELLEAEPQVLALIRDVIKPELERSGLKPVIDEKGNLIVSLKGRSQGKRLLLVGYAMCAAPSTMKEPYSGALVDGGRYQLAGECVWGRGACEQKGSLAAMMAMVKLLGECRAELPADLFFVVSTAGETGRHDSLAHVMARGNVKADWAIVDGPPEIQLGNKGRVDIQVVVRGKQAHSSRPWDGVNAIEGAVKVLEKLRPLMPYPSERTHPELGKVSLTTTAIESFPKATHTIQSECRIIFDRRLLPGDDPDEAIQQIKTAIGAVEPFAVEVHRKDFMYPSEVAKDAECVLALTQAIQVTLGRDANYSYSTAANDTGFLNAKGMQAVNYGSRYIRFQHTDHDLVPVQSVFEAAKVLAFAALHR